MTCLAEVLMHGLFDEVLLHNIFLSINSVACLS